MTRSAIIFVQLETSKTFALYSILTYITFVITSTLIFRTGHCRRFGLFFDSIDVDSIIVNFVIFIVIDFIVDFIANFIVDFIANFIVDFIRFGSRVFIIDFCLLLFCVDLFLFVFAIIFVVIIFVTIVVICKIMAKSFNNTNWVSIGKWLWFEIVSSRNSLNKWKSRFLYSALLMTYVQSTYNNKYRVLTFIDYRIYYFLCTKSLETLKE